MLSTAEHNPNMSTYMRAKTLYFPYKYEKIVFLENSNIIKSLKVKSMNQLKKKKVASGHPDGYRTSQGKFTVI